MPAARRLIVITGPTASGKSALAISLAKHLGTEIISADSRQIYHGIPIVTALPSPEELSTVRHHLIDMLPLDAYYSAAQFEQDALAIINRLFDEGHRHVVMCGGSSMYVDAVCRGIDDLPSIPDDIRHRVASDLEHHGLDYLVDTLNHLDPLYAAQVDLKNTKRVAHAVEICLAAGRPYSALRTGRSRPRSFEIIKFALDFPRDTLFDRINQRVLSMVDSGLVDEARRVYPLRHLNSLNTVGLKELFTHFDALWDLDTAIARIQKNTRVYAKKQITWLNRDKSVHWISPLNPLESIIKLLDI